ncbi:helix-turn-helix transcriptional regulator [Glaciecola sp. 1036]|uniref:helix-turn-helix transcriptional regulator n=1 Tax=Alteromonadaceae TaxID=72275 RepID=UPI003CFF8B82
MLFIDAFFRFTGIGLLVLIVILAIRDLSWSRRLALLLLTNTSLVFHFLATAPAPIALPTDIGSLLRLGNILMLPSVWLLLLSLFQKDFRITYWHITAYLTLSLAMLAERFVFLGWLQDLPDFWAVLVNLISLLMVAHMLATIVLGRHDDLLEKRRQSRLYVTLVICLCATLTIVLGSIVLHEYQDSVSILSLWPAILCMALWIFHINPQSFAFAEPVPEIKEMSVKDQQLFDQLQEIMTEQKAYLDSKLTIDALAKRLAVSDSRLRNFIQQHSQCTNFSSYLNTFRIQAVQRALKDPEKEHLPILTLALDHGFNSLPPFNRAFKKHTGMTPSQYRTLY